MLQVPLIKNSPDSCEELSGLLLGKIKLIPPYFVLLSHANLVIVCFLKESLNLHPNSLFIADAVDLTLPQGKGLSNVLVSPTTNVER